jgi:hypothetical protein
MTFSTCTLWQHAGQTRPNQKNAKLLGKLTLVDAGIHWYQREFPQF